MQGQALVARENDEMEGAQNKWTTKVNNWEKRKEYF
jgi:hypothetical protein